MYDELIAALRFCDGGECDGCCRYKKGHGAECYTLLRDAADAIEELSKPRWIPVTERLPEEKYAVLVWVPKYRNHYACFISDGEWYLYGGHNVIVVGVTHWMPLPEPPKEET